MAEFFLKTEELMFTFDEEEFTTKVKMLLQRVSHFFRKSQIQKIEWDVFQYFAEKSGSTKVQIFLHSLDSSL